MLSMHCRPRCSHLSARKEPAGSCAAGAPRCRGVVRAGRSQNGGLSPGVGQSMLSSTLPLTAGAPASSLTAGAGGAAAASRSKTTCRSSPCHNPPGLGPMSGAKGCKQEPRLLRQAS